MSNWLYANVVPTETWRNAMTIPRELKLKHIGNDVLIASQPIKEFINIQAKPIDISNLKITKNINFRDLAVNVKFPCRINLNLEEIRDFSFVLTNNIGDETVIGFDKKNNQYFIDRTKSGKTDFQKDFAARHVAPRFVDNNKMNISVVIDVSSVELFADDGLTVMTAIYFPNKPYNQIYIQSQGTGTIKKIEYINLK